MSAATVIDIPKIEVSWDNTSVCELSNKENLNMQIKGSHGNLTTAAEYLSDHDLKCDRRSFTLSETDDEEYVRFYGLKRNEVITNSDSTGPTVIIDPPSPPNHHEENESADNENRPLHEAIRRLSGNCRRCKFLMK